MSNLTDSLFEAISTIAEKRIANLKYDKTVICTVTSIDNAKNNLYSVSDGSVVFEAQGDGTQYKVGDNVRVLILEGDYAQTKYIQGKHNTKEVDKPITYVSAMNSIIDLTDNLIDADTYSSIKGVAANSTAHVEEHIATIDLTTLDHNVANNDVFNTLYIKGDFWSAFDQYEMRSGDYGLHVVIGLDNGEEATGNRYDRLDLRLSALKDMFGNPYAFKVFTPQEITFTLSSWPENAKAVYVYLYQNKNFKYYDYATSLEQFVPISLINDNTTEVSNIKVKNVQIGFGSKIESIGDNSLKIYTNNTQAFDHREGSTSGYNKKKLQMLWYNKSENNEYLGFSDGVYEEGGYDEEAYLAAISTDTRLINIRDSKNYTTIPHDENCLDLQADILDVKEATETMSELIGTELWRALKSFKDATTGLSFSTHPLTTLLNETEGASGSLLTYQTNIETDINTLSSLYQTILTNAKTNTVCEIKNGETALTTESDISAYINAIHERLAYYDDSTSVTAYYNIIASAINSAINGETNSIKAQVEAQNQYADTFTTYNNAITKILNKIKKQAKVNHLYYNNDNTKTNGTRLAKLVKLTSETTVTIGETYGSKTTDDEFVSNNANRYCAYWYKKDSTQLIPDGIMSAGWRRIENSKNIGIPEEDTSNEGYLKKTDNSGLEIICANAVRTETFVAVLFYNHEKIVSNELVFTNDAETLTSAEVNLEGEIIIHHGSNSQESYQLYNEYGSLNNMGDSQRVRKLRVKYSFAGVEETDEFPEGETSYLTNALVYWYVPNSSTQLTITNSDATGFSTVATDQTTRYKSGYTGYYKTINSSTLENDTTFTYHIKSQYQNTNTQNHIICEVVKLVNDEEVVHSITQYFNFTSFGNQGTDYTLALMAGVDQPMMIAPIVVNEVHSEAPLLINPKLYDFNNNELTFKHEDVDGSRAFTKYGPSTGYDLEVIADATSHIVSQCKIWKTEQTSPVYWNVLECKVKNVQIDELDKQIDLTSYFSIPYAPANTTYIEGASTILYSSSGNNPQYYKSPYKLYSKADNELQANITWIIRYYNTDGSSYYDGKYISDAFKFYDSTGTEITNSDTLKSLSAAYVPRLDKDNNLVAANMFIDNLNQYPVVLALNSSNEVQWAQPILIRQNRHGSAMMNAWNGKISMDENSDTILASMVGAGRKNSNNEFEGVLMGEVQQGSDEATLGIYGYNNGAQSFGFKIDGTGFIGKSGKGRILFNGDTSEIKSQRYNDGTGMSVDLDNGILDIKNNAISLIQLNVKDTGHTSEPYMYIKKDSNTPLMWINDDDYYLQSANYKNTEDQKAGTKFDLVEGHLDAYNFKLTSKNVIIDSSATAPAFFEIKNDASQSLFKASNSQYYLQTANFDNAGSTGVKIDLSDGHFKLKTPQIYLGDTPENNYYFKIGNGLTVDNNFNLSVTGNINATSGYFHNVEIYGKNPTNLLTKVSDQTYKIACGNFDNDSYEITTQGTGYRLTGAEANATSVVSGFYEALNGDKTHYPTWCNNYLRMLFTAEPGEELYYRITIPSTEVKNFGLTKGTKYILSGQISLQKYEDTSPSSFDPTGNIDRVTVRTERSKNGAFSGGINTKILDDFTTTSKVSDAGGVANRDWGEPTFEDFAVEFTVENDADNYYISFQLYPTLSSANAAACLCIKDLKLYEAGLCGEISPTNGFALWKGLKGNGNSATDTNLLFKVDENGAFLRGQIHATAGGTIGGWNIGSNYLITNNSLGQSNAFHMYSGGAAGTVAGVTLSSTSDEQWMLGIGSHFGVTNTGALYASAGNIAGFYINSQDMTIYSTGSTSGIENVLGFLSKGTQTGKYAVGSSVLKDNWFIWNKGGSNGSVITGTDANGNTAEGIKGVFGVDMDGNLYATAGYIGPLQVTSTGLGILNTGSDGYGYYADSTFISSNSLETKRILINGVRIGNYSTFYGQSVASNFPTADHIMHWAYDYDWISAQNKYVVFGKKEIAFYEGEREKETKQASVDWAKLIESGYSGHVDLARTPTVNNESDWTPRIIQAGCVQLSQNFYFYTATVSFPENVAVDGGVTINLPKANGIVTAIVTPLANPSSGRNDNVCPLSVKCNYSGVSASDYEYDNAVRIIWDATAWSANAPLGCTLMALTL